MLETELTCDMVQGEHLFVSTRLAIGWSAVTVVYWREWQRSRFLLETFMRPAFRGFLALVKSSAATQQQARTASQALAKTTIIKAHHAGILQGAA